ncbi:MAG: hypothetical protein L3J75_00495 [Methylococcaceae bacterium]|nr:hypothetical protein [Methylococcaceae bacterium]
MADNAGNSTTPISLPKGGGAIKGIGETFQPNLFSGTGNFSIPIATTPGRDGFGPQLTLQYSSGSGNGPFGLGWQLSMPRITRKTEKGLPTYTDQDVFVMSGAEDLVPYLEAVSETPEKWEPVVTKQGAFSVSLFRPRTEGQFARIERWTDPDGNVHWRATTKENVTSIYGRTASARIVDPQQPDQVFEWLLQETFDNKGNHILYEYIQEDPFLQLAGIHEQNRHYTQAYIRRILYGNTPATLDANLTKGPIRTTTDHTNPLKRRERNYLFEVLFDYGDLPQKPKIPDDLNHDIENIIPDNWPVREDPFSSFRAGFEIRTLRRCQRVLMLHHFREGELEAAPLVKSSNFQYTVNADTQLSFLSTATVTGYRKDPDNVQQYLERSLPAISFKYSTFEPHKQHYQSVTANGEAIPPRSLAAPDFTAMDVFGNGMPDILQDTGNGLRYWQNLGQGHLDRNQPQSGDQPTHSFSQSSVSFADMGGDGLVDLVVDDPPVSGFYESTPDGRWKNFQRFKTMPGFDLADPNTRLLDLTGDGLSDVLVTRDNHFLWFRCLGESGYDQPRRIPRKQNLEHFPDVFFDDPAGRVRLADMTGDGLSDIVLVHDGRIDYWPNLGYGRFGKRLTMSNTPRIGFSFDPRRMFLADLDGSGGTDLVYVDREAVHFWFNQSGNAWSSQQTIKGTPKVSDLTAIQFIDFYGTGTTTLLWSYDAGEHAGSSNYKILDFCGGKKPNLLVEMDNNMGATTRVQYAASTKFYLQDKVNGKPWITNLPFPVQVLEKTEVIDHISKTKQVTRYQYHHGYYDGREREFRGFGRVDQFDTEFFDDFNTASLHGEEILFDNGQSGFHIPPVETRTWFHTGIYFDAERHLDHRALSEQYQREYYRGDTQAFKLEEHEFEQSDGLQGMGDTPHEASRALRGAVLHTEVYARDGSDKADHPYTVSDHRYRITALQPKNGNNHAVFLTTSKENVNYHYERNPDDPRISQNLTLGIDDYGNVTDSVAIAYPRRAVPDALPEQGESNIVYSHIDFINVYQASTATGSAFYYAGIPFQTREYEVTGLDWQSGQSQLKELVFASVLDASSSVDTNTFKPYPWQRKEADTEIQRRMIEWTRSYFRSNSDPDQIDPIGNLDHRLALGEIDSLALPYESYQAVFTTTLLENIYAERIAGIDLASEGGYHPHLNHAESEGNGGIENYRWIPSGRQNFNPQKFYQSEQAQDPFGNTTTVLSDVYALLTETAKDALPAPQTNVIVAKNDYRVLQAFEMTDPNGNRSQVAFDALGLVVGTAVMGEDAEGNIQGDSLAGFVADLTDAVRNQHIDDPLNVDARHDSNPHNILKSASTRLLYALDRYAETGQANVVYTLSRETHVSGEQGTPARIQHAFVYSDGFGRESQTKVQAEPDRTTPTKPRWVGTGTTVYNNKGKAVQQFEPFFSDDHHHGIEQQGVSSTVFYDPLARVVCTVHPNHSYEKVLFDPWQQTSWDTNDTLLLDPRIDSDIMQYVDAYFIQYDRAYQQQHGVPPQTWYQAHILSDDAVTKATAEKTEPHANTPSVAYLDTLARPFLTITDNGQDEAGKAQQYATRVVLDIENNQHEVIDALGRKVMHYDFDMLGNALHQASMEAGERWMLNDVAGHPIRTWDSRGHQFRNHYDSLRRPVESWLSENSTTEQMVEKTVYGESLANPENKNLRGQAVQVFDQAGVASSDHYDFKGNLLSNQRQLATNYKTTLDWSSDVALETERYRSSTRYDALNRPVQVTAPDNSRIRPLYNEANLLESVTTQLQGKAETTVFVSNIDYDAKGQRQRIAYGNGASTHYEYDPLTYRLVHMITQRDAITFPDDCPQPPPAGSPGCQIQNLHYSYDPVGNITHIRDDAQQTVYFRNQRVEPSNDYSYDAIYRLINATGREHLGQGGAPVLHSHNDAQRVGLLQPGDGNAMGRYTEQYLYDAVGNILTMQHRGSNLAHPAWTRDYAYNEASLLEAGKVSNRLSTTTVGTTTETYAYEGSAGLHGNITAMPHLSQMQWDYRDQLQATAKQAVNGESMPETTWYVYDGSGERVRKLIELANGNIKQERIYLGGFEIFRKYNTDGSIELERETLHIMDDQQRIALLETRTVGDDGSANQLVRYQFTNHLGSTGLELNGQGQIISYEEYTPYGSTSYQAVRSATEVPRKRYRYTGMERDEESGFSYHSARYYLSWLGRWVSADPEGLVDGTNLYHYASNNPLRFFDLEGNEPKRPRQSFRDWARNTVFSKVFQLIVGLNAARNTNVPGSGAVPKLLERISEIEPAYELISKPEPLPPKNVNSSPLGKPEKKQGKGLKKFHVSEIEPAYELNPKPEPLPPKNVNSSALGKPKKKQGKGLKKIHKRLSGSPQKNNTFSLHDKAKPNNGLAVYADPNIDSTDSGLASAASSSAYSAPENKKGRPAVLRKGRFAKYTKSAKVVFSMLSKVLNVFSVPTMFDSATPPEFSAASPIRPEWIEAPTEPGHYDYQVVVPIGAMNIPKPSEIPLTYPNDHRDAGKPVPKSRISIRMQ